MCVYIGVSLFLDGIQRIRWWAFCEDSLVYFYSRGRNKLLHVKTSASTLSLHSLVTTSRACKNERLLDRALKPTPLPTDPLSSTG